MNVDVCVGDGELGLGVVCLDNTGALVLVGSSRITGPPNPLLGKALACRWGISLALRWGFMAVHIESDSRSLISKIGSHGADRSYVAATIDDIHVSSIAFDSVRFFFVNRSANSVAHFATRLCSAVNF